MAKPSKQTQAIRPATLAVAYARALSAAAELAPTRQHERHIDEAVSLAWAEAWALLEEAGFESPDGEIEDASEEAIDRFLAD